MADPQPWSVPTSQGPDGEHLLMGQVQIENMEVELDELRGEMLHERENASHLETALHDSETKR